MFAFILLSKFHQSQLDISLFALNNTFYASFNFTFIDNLITMKIFIIIKEKSLHKVKNYTCISFIRPFLLGIWNKCKGKLKQNMVPLSIVKLLFRVNREKIYDIDVIL